MLQKVSRFISQHQLINDRDRVLVAYSGGPDSTCLLVILQSLLKNVSAVYVNHQLRDSESEQEEAFVRKFCEEAKIPLFVETIGWKTVPANLEESARKRRYAHLLKVAAEHNFNKVALAHHQDDLTETFLLRLIRGTGPQGLVGMVPERGIYIRPLLSVKRTEILDFLAQRKISFFVDTSNQNLQFTRNRIRNELIPYVEKQFNPGFREALNRDLAWFMEQNELVNELLRPFRKLIGRRTGMIAFKKVELMNLSVPLRKAIIRMALLEADPGLRLTSNSLQKLLDSIDQNRPMELSGFLKVRIEKGVVLIGQKQDRIGANEISVPGPGIYLYSPSASSLRFSLQSGSNYDTDPTVACLDFDGCSFPLIIRNWKRGDSYQPLGMKGQKKLSDFWIDRKVPRAMRKKIPLVFKGDDLLWIAGYQIDHRYRVTDKTRQVLRIELLPLT